MSRGSRAAGSQRRRGSRFRGHGSRRTDQESGDCIPRCLKGLGMPQTNPKRRRFEDCCPPPPHLRDRHQSDKSIVASALACSDETLTWTTVGAPSRAPKKLAKPYLYPTKATARVAPMGVAGEEVLTHPKPGNPPRRISLSVQVRFCQFFLGHFRLRRNRRAAPRLRRGLLFWIRRVPTARADGLGLSPQARQPRRYAAECDHAAQECLAAWRSSPCASSPHSFDFDWPTAI